jgi:hypothetical protein
MIRANSSPVPTVNSIRLAAMVGSGGSSARPARCDPRHSHWHWDIAVPGHEDDGNVTDCFVQLDLKIEPLTPSGRMSSTGQTGSV